MTFDIPQKIAALAELIGAKIYGNTALEVTGTNEIHRVKNGELVFVNHPKYYEKALKSAASVVLIDQPVEFPADKALLISQDPFRDFNLINTHFRHISHFENEAHTLEVGEGSFIHPSVVLGRNVTIGKNCRIYPNVVIGDYTEIGDEVIIQSGTVIGGDAFYYRKIGKRFERLQSVGNVRIENRVEIGNNCTIDRGVTDTTVIGEGSVLDNQIQIGHDTILGKRVLIASQVGIAGACTIGDDVTIWGQVGIASGKKIASGTVLLAKTGVNRDLEAGTYLGMFAENARDYMRKEVRLKNL